MTNRWSICLGASLPGTACPTQPESGGALEFGRAQWPGRRVTGSAPLRVPRPPAGSCFPMRAASVCWPATGRLTGRCLAQSL